MTLTLKKAKKIGTKGLNWSQKLELARKYAWNRLYRPEPFNVAKRTIPGGIRNLDRIIGDLLD
jgi:hypothetical protein